MPGQLASEKLITVHFTTSDPKGIVPAYYAFTPGDAGSHVFSVTIHTVGPRTVTAIDTSDSSLTATSTTITVQPGPAVALLILGVIPNPIVLVALPFSFGL